MKARDLVYYITHQGLPDYEVIIVAPDGSRQIAYVERSGSERLIMLVPQDGYYKRKSPHPLPK